MYDNFQYEKIVWIFILSIGVGGCVSFFCLFKYFFFVSMHLLYRAEVITC